MIRFLRLTLSLLSPRQQRRYVWVVLYFLFAGVVQVVGTVSIAPFITLVSNPQYIHNNVAAQWAYDFLGVSSDKSFLVVFAFALIGLIWLTNAVAAFATWLIAWFGTNAGIELQQDIYRGFLHRDFALLARANSSELIATITNDSSRFIYMVVQPILTVISQAFIVSLVVISIIIYDPVVAAAAALLIGGGYFAVFRYLKVHLERDGETMWRTGVRKLRMLQESLGGVKEIKLAGTEAHYEREIDVVNSDGTRASIRMGLLGDLPKFVLESIAFSAMLLLGIYLLSVHDRPQEIVGSLSLYAMAGYKLMPAAQTIFKSASQIRANANVTDVLVPAVEAGRSHAHLRHESLPPSDGALPEVRFENVSYRYPSTDHPVVRNLDFTLPSGAVTVFVGSSGAGKSTAADILLGLLRPETGDVFAGDESIFANVRRWQRRLGYVAQNIFLVDDSIAANIAFGSEAPIDHIQLKRAADMAHVTDFALAQPGGFDARVGERGGLLSGGQRQRIGIARALYRHADLLVLDEATSALDALTEREIIGTLDELKRDKTIVMIAHRLTTIQAADYVLMFEKGEIVARGTYRELIEGSEAFKRLVAGTVHGRQSQGDTLRIA